MSLAFLAVLAVIALATGFGVLLIVVGLIGPAPAAATAAPEAVVEGLGLEAAVTVAAEPAEAPPRRPVWRRLAALVRPAAARIEEQRTESGRPTMRSLLASADVRLREDEYLVIEIGSALLVAVLSALRFGVGLQTVLFAAAGWLVPGFYIRYRRRRRRRAFERQLGDTLLLLASSLRAGHSLTQAIETVSRSMQPPVAAEFDRAVREIALGLSVEEALFNILARIPSRDFELFVTAVAIQYRSGGNLAEVLERIAETIAERVALKGEISTLTAQARASGFIISVLPLAVVVLLVVLAPAYFDPMVHSGIGIVLLAIAAVLILVGNVFIRRVVNIEGVR